MNFWVVGVLRLNTIVTGTSTEGLYRLIFCVQYHEYDQSGNYNIKIMNEMGIYLYLTSSI